MDHPVLKVTDLVKDFGPVRPVDGISFELKRGDILGLLGANAAGKTTAINMILGMISIALFVRVMSTAREKGLLTKFVS